MLNTAINQPHQLRSGRTYGGTAPVTATTGRGGQGRVLSDEVVDALHPPPAAVEPPQPANNHGSVDQLANNRRVDPPQPANNHGGVI